MEGREEEAIRSKRGISEEAAGVKRGERCREVERGRKGVRDGSVPGGSYRLAYREEGERTVPEREK